MDLSLAGLFDEVRYSLTNPRPGLRRILSMNLPASAAWSALGLMAIFSAVLVHFSFAMVPTEEQDMVIDMVAWLSQSPLRSFMLQSAVMLLQVLLIFWLGRARGGKGTFADTLTMVAWFQFLMLIIQLLQLAVQILLPPLATLVNLAGLGIFLWIITNFVAEVHGFRSLPYVFGGIILGSIVLLFLLAIAMLLVMGMPTVEA